MIHADLLAERARLTPNALALVEVASGRRFTYGELDARALRCAVAWQALGLGHGDRVAILAHNRVEYLDAFFAAPKLGVVLVTLGTRLTAHELAHIVNDCSPRVMLFDGELAGTAETLRTMVEVEHWVAFDPLHQAENGLMAETELSDYAGMIADADPAGFEPTPCQADDVYCLLYTSGTTGRPKGVMIPHRQVIWNGYNTACGWQLRSDDVSSIFTPLYHAGGLMAFLVPIFTVGGTIVLHRHFDAGEIWRTLESEGATVVLGVPTIWKMLLEAPEFDSVDLSSVRWLISGGAPLPQFLAQAYRERGIDLKQGFGMTEVGVNCFAMTVEDSRRKVGSIGKPMMFTEVRLIDDAGHDVAPGEVGELLFRGPHVCLGYWHQPASTAAALDDEGWFHSGDAARCDEHGYFYIAGRNKDMIISGGVNVYPAEIEAALLRHPRVEDAAVVGIPDQRWGEVSVAFVVERRAAENPDTLSSETLSAHLSRLLARYKLPKIYRTIDELPRTAYGKVQKGTLRDAYLAQIGDASSDSRALAAEGAP